MTNIKFGTDGWRAVVGEDFNSENVTLATNAIAKYISDNFGLDKKIIIGYDPRNMADVYSKLCADTLVQKGFSVLYSKKVVPTPVLAYSAKHLDACAIMCTSSHNPPKYLGLKFIPDYAGPATSEITDEIVKNIGESIENSIHGSFEYYDFTKDYFKHLETLIDFDRIKKAKIDIIFDGLYSATIGYFDKILKENSVSESDAEKLRKCKKEEQAHILSILKASKLTDTVYIKSEEEFESSGGAYLSFENVFSDLKLKYTYENYLEHIRLTESFKNENYRLIKSESKIFDNIVLSVAHGNYAVVSKASHPVIHFIIRHPKLAGAIENFDPLVK